MHVVYHIMSNGVLVLRYLSCEMPLMQCLCVLHFCNCEMLSVLVWMPSRVSWLTPLQCGKLNVGQIIFFSACETDGCVSEGSVTCVAAVSSSQQD